MTIIDLKDMGPGLSMDPESRDAGRLFSPEILVFGGIFGMVK